MNKELAKQMGMMPGQEKIVQDYYQKNPAALNSLRGNIYEEKIISEIKKNGKSNKIEITKDQAEKILKDENEKNLKNQAKFSVSSDETKDKKETKISTKKTKETEKKANPSSKKKKSSKKVSKK